MNKAVAVSKRAQAKRDALSEAGQQEADAEQGRKRDDKPDGGAFERWCRRRRKIRHCDICLTHDEHPQTIQLAWKIDKKDSSGRAARREFICPIGTPMSVAGGTQEGPVMLRLGVRPLHSGQTCP